jgi:hypothetical protein
MIFLVKIYRDKQTSSNTSWGAFGFAKDETIKYNVPTPKGEAPRDLVPSSIAVIRMIQGQASAKLVKARFDSGGTKTFINSKCLPWQCGATQALLKTLLHGITADGCL